MSGADVSSRAPAPRNVVCFGSDWYSPSKVSVRHLVDVLRDRGSRVLWINPVPVRFPNARRKEFWGKVQNKARTHARLLARPSPGVYVYSPLYLPLYTPLGFRLNRLAVSAQVLFLRLVLGMSHPLVIGSMFTAWFALPAVRSCTTLFHFADKISAFREVANDPQRRAVLERMEREIVEASTLATCSSRYIMEHVRELVGEDKGKAVYLPHAVRAGSFREVDPAMLAAPPELDGMARPLAGYFGSLTHTNDVDTFAAAARALPGWGFVFIGRVSGDYSQLEALPNVVFLGPQPHERIPEFGAAFDVCFMGWKPHEWITNCFPLKTIEYLALGKPVVCSSEINELRERFPELVTITGSPDEFRAALVAAVASDDDEARRRRKEAVRDDTWENRMDEILTRLVARNARYAV